jgi:hypothetical protein
MQKVRNNKKTRSLRMLKNTKKACLNLRDKALSLNQK